MLMLSAKRGKKLDHTGAGSAEFKENLPSPLSLHSLRGLLFKPREFFQTYAEVDRRELMIAGYFLGITTVMSRIDLKMAAIPESGPIPENLYWLATSWANYWFLVLGIGAIAGIVVYYIGGWWYMNRLKWSGASSPNNLTACRLNAYQDLVTSIPVVLFTVMQTIIYPNYAEAWSEDWLFALLAFIMWIWSCRTSFIAAVSTYELVKWRAILWFIVLPISLLLVSAILISVMILLSGD